MNEDIAKALVFWEDHEDAKFFKEVSPAEVTDTSRWSIYYSTVYQDTRDGKYWRIDYDTGATEYQESSEDVYITEVYPSEKTITVYLPIDKAA